MERVGLILQIKYALESRLNSGCAISSLDGKIACIQLFFDYCTKNNMRASIDNLEDAYIEYCEHLFQESSKKNPRIKPATAYGYGATLSNLFGEILNIPIAIELINRTRLHYPKAAKKSVGRQADKQNLENTYKMGSFLIDIISGITINSIYGELPFEIIIRNGLVENGKLELTLGAFRSKYEYLLSNPDEASTKGELKALEMMRKNRGVVESIKGSKRYYFVNLRVAAEFLVFIAQTGMNSEQARNLPRSNFKYKPIGDSWEVRCYKGRRGGEVSFKVYKSYKPYINEYIRFLNHFFPESDLLFPWLTKDATISKSRKMTYRSIYNLMMEYEIPWISPQKLRNTRVNWCLRRSRGDADLTSEMHQHFRETLRDKYELPSQQRSMVELTRFWNKNDPIKKGDLKISLISSLCSGTPVAMEDKPSTVVSPNCINQSGCLWCKSFRDLDSFDYVWSLASFRHLKTIEATALITSDEVPADLAIARLTEKLTWYQESSAVRKAWVEEAEIRISEGDYHPNWSGILEFVE